METKVQKINVASKQAELMIAELLVNYYEETYVTRSSNLAEQPAVYIENKIGATGKISSNGDYCIVVENGNVQVYKGKSKKRKSNCKRNVG